MDRTTDVPVSRIQSPRPLETRKGSFVVSLTSLDPSKKHVSFGECGIRHNRPFKVLSRRDQLSPVLCGDTFRGEG